MPDLTISGHDSLISAEIIARRETYYLVSNDNLRDLTSKSLFADLFGLIASICWGGFFSAKITVSASTSLLDATRQVLDTYSLVFLLAAIVFTLLAGAFLTLKFRQIQGIKKSTLPPTAQSGHAA